MSRFSFVTAAMVLSAALSWSGLAGAQSFPSKPVHLIVAYPPGTSTDILARIVAPTMSDLLGQPVVVENRPGVSGSIGAHQLASALPDGYTIMMGTSGNIVANETLMDLPYDPASAFSAVGGVAQNPQILAVRASLPVDSVPELVSYLKSNPEAATYGSTGVGGTPALAGALFDHLAGLNAVHVPYTSAAQALTALMNGEVGFMFYGSSGMIAQLEAGTLKPLANGAMERTPMWPDLQTMVELGYEDFSATSWFGIFAPSGLPKPAMDVLSKAVAETMSDEETLGRLRKIGFDPLIADPEAMETFVTGERDRIKDLVARFGGGQP